MLHHGEEGVLLHGEEEEVLLHRLQLSDFWVGDVQEWKTKYIGRKFMSRDEKNDNSLFEEEKIVVGHL